jgi:mersacidin/lichenicidin family type 2 lantibiotic
MNIDIARAWKDLDYRNSLSIEEQALLPANPAGEVELTEAELTQVNGGMIGTTGFDGCFTVGHCTTQTANADCP